MDIRDTIKATNTAIATVDLVKDYGSGNNTVHALRGVNVAFEKGKFTAIMGPSGSGKSTLMHTLAGLDCATGGHIIFNGDDLTRMNDNQLTLLRRRDIGFIFQSFNLLPNVHRRTEHSHAIDLGWSETRPTVVASAGGNAWP